MRTEFYRDELKSKISAQINKVCEIVADENAQHRTNVNSSLEDIIARVINIYKGTNLVNMNKGSKQVAGIDIGDKSQRIAYQVTSESNTSKIRDCLDKFESNSWYKDYDQLIIFFATDYKPDLANLTLKNDYSFVVKDVLSYVNKNGLKAEIDSECETERLSELHDYLALELGPYIDNPRNSIPVINEIISTCIERIKTSPPVSTISADERLLHSKEKIELNFQGTSDADQVTEYLRHSLAYSDTIAEAINQYPGLDPVDLEDYMRDVYNKHKLKDSRSMHILLAMFDSLVPAEKADDIIYLSWSRRFVMKYFENCTIFERTKAEQQTLGV